MLLSFMKPLRLPLLLAGLSALCLAASVNAAPEPGGPSSYVCKGTIYLTFDTGSQSQAEFIADTLKRHHIKATFFLANEKTIHGDYSLDDGWIPLWKRLVADGHAFGSHTFDHVYAKRDLPEGKLQMKPQFGPQAGQLLSWTPAQYCAEINHVADRFHQMTGAKLDHFWRAPGGHLTPGTLKAGEACGYQHAAWSPAGFSGDELPSETYSNARLLSQSLAQLRDGDIFLAHMGIWSRKDAWAPANLEPLLVGLEQKHFCFATLRDRPNLTIHAH